MADNIFTRFFGSKKEEERSISYLPTTSLGLPYGGYSTAPISVQSSMQLSAVYRAVDVISDAIASQMWEVKKYSKMTGWTDDMFHYSIPMLNTSPNPAMGRFMFMKTLVAKVILEGNGFVVIHRKLNGDPEWLELVNGAVKMFVNNDLTTYYEITNDVVDNEDVRTIQGEDMIHILNFSYNGYIGVSTLTHAASTLGLAVSAESSATGYYSSGANMSGILSVEGKLTPEKAEGIKNSWAAAFDLSTGTPGGIAVMEKGLNFIPVSISAQDAQLLETRKFNVQEIGRFFGVSPTKLFDDGSLTYSNVEALSLGFITDTIAPLDAKIESEFNRKLYRPSERINTQLNLSIKELILNNADSKANYLSKMFATGGYTINELRAEIGEGRFDDPNADKPMAQVNMQTIDRFGKPKVEAQPPKVEAPPVDDVKKKDEM